MRRRILLGLIGVGALSISLFAVPLSLVIQQFYRNETVLFLERQATQASADVPVDFAATGDPVEFPKSPVPTEIGLYNPTGALASGSGPPRADPQTTEALGGRIADGRSNGRVTVAVPLTSGEIVIGAIRVQASTAPTTGRIHRAWAFMAVLALVVLGVTALVAWFLARRLSRPVQTLTRSLDLLGSGAVDLGIIPSGVAEIDEAQNALLATAERLDEALARERAFSAEASHQLRTPVASLRLAIETEMADPRPDPNDALREALDDIDRLDVTITALLALARRTLDARADLNAVQVAADTVERWHGPFGHAARRLRFDCSIDSIHLVARQAAIEQAMDVLLDNALGHGEGDTLVSLQVVAGGVSISVRTEGPPIGAPEAIWSPQAESGRRRIGLSLARRMVEGEGGRLVLARAAPHPTFEILLPATSPH